jgi:hypothetical protein
MPFTFAHPAAAIPLLRPLGHFGVLSALVVGSITPDLWRFLPFGITRLESHSLFGLLWFCLPVGLFVYVLFHLLLKGPLLGLLPPFAASRLGAYTLRFQSLPSASWPAVVISLLLGAATHIAWDSITHSGTSTVRALPALDAHLFSVGDYPVYVFKVLQHGSAAVGLLLLVWWSWWWLRRAPVNAVALPVSLSPTQRLAVLAGIAGITVLTGVWAGMLALVPELPADVLPIQVFVRKAVFYGLRGLAATVILYSVGWHGWRVKKYAGRRVAG